MVGLIYKDIYCLKKNIKLFVVITLGVIVLSVLLILSMQYGNIQTFLSTEEITEEEFFSLFQAAIWCVLILPIAAATMITDCYKEDKKASFSKCLYTLPVKEEVIVGSRYIAGVLFLLLGLVGSVVASVCISFATDVFSLGQLISYCVTFTAVLLVYLAFLMFLLYTVDGRKADFIQCIPLVILFFVAEYLIVEKGGDLSAEEFSLYMTNMEESINQFMIKNSVWLLLAAFGIVGISYLGSVMVRKKRGIS